MIALAFLLGYLDDYFGPQLYHYQDRIVNVYEKYQCPKYCKINHPHFVYYKSLTNGIVIDKNQLGPKVKKKKVSNKK
tara:strand:+ start:297 stop:527 length:231 start_codon:yes stop_codon:yes gene_type:complete